MESGKRGKHFRQGYGGVGWGSPEMGLGSVLVEYFLCKGDFLKQVWTGRMGSDHGIGILDLTWKTAEWVQWGIESVWAFGSGSFCHLLAGDIRQLTWPLLIKIIRKYH